jgi:hypothetical protein
VWRKLAQKWRTEDLVLHYDNAHAHSVISHPPYSPDLALYDLYPKLNVVLKGRDLVVSSQSKKNHGHLHGSKHRTTMDAFNSGIILGFTASGRLGN